MTRLHPYWIPGTLVLAALVLWQDPLPPDVPRGASRRTPAWAIDPTPVRRPTLRPLYTVGAFTYSCSDCHRIIPSSTETRRSLTQHREVRLQHGLNTRCFNCHHRTQRDAFVDDFGDPIPWDQPQRLCAKCHGPVYRDWQQGSHGRINGYWDSRRGPQTRRRCIECHDPHAPPFAPLKPAPGPNTLRMGSPAPVPHGAEHDPLRIYAQPHAANPEH